MTWTNLELMALIDGEGDAAGRAALEAALQTDADLRRRWSDLAAQRQRVAAAYAPILEEPVPDRLLALLAPVAAPAAAPASGPAAAPVVNLAEARAQRESRRRPSWAQWGGMAACLVLGVTLGLQLAPRGGSLLTDAGGLPVAGPSLAQALATQLAADVAPAGGVQVQLSFVDKAGRYCRTFSTAGLAGLACRDDQQWAVLSATRTETDATGPGSTMRQAGSALPKAVLEAVDARIIGDTFSAEQERAARERGWRR
jgi:anti-sigma factor RsiW